jgi:hypothetical protein
MNLKTTAIAAGLAAALGTTGAIAQSYSQESPPPAQQMPYRHHHGHHHGVLALIGAEVDAGRISHKEGTLLERKIKEMKAERRAERQARYESRQDNGNPGNSEQGNPQQPPR